MDGYVINSLCAANFFRNDFSILFDQDPFLKVGLKLA
jgi:hypothetical protein